MNDEIQISCKRDRDKDRWKEIERERYEKYTAFIPFSLCVHIEDIRFGSCTACEEQ